MKVQLDKHIGDVVWLMNDDQAVQGTVESALYRQFISNTDYEKIITVERYNIAVKSDKTTTGTKTINCPKEDLFPDKESLIKSL